METINIYSKNNKNPIIIRDVKKAGTLFQKLRGLMFRKRKNSKAILFNTKKPIAIHSYFVFFPFIAIWLNQKNKIVKIKKVHPFTSYIKPKKHFSKILEIPINNKYKKIIKKFLT